MTTPSAESEANTLDIKLLISSFLKIEPQADEFAETFYNVLFQKYPGMVPLFANTDMDKQKSKLIESLELVMGNIHNPEAFASILKNLGHKHVSYGAVLTDYPLIGDALLQALERHLGKDWNPEVERAWILGYQKISELMAEGAKTVKEEKVNLFARNLISTAQDNRSINARASTVDARSTNSATTSIFRKGTLVIGIGIIALLGYVGWRVMQTQPTNSIQPIPIERSK
jgi:hemoglobin-like flavoprotein